MAGGRCGGVGIIGRNNRRPPPFSVHFRISYGPRSSIAAIVVSSPYPVVDYVLCAIAADDFFSLSIFSRKNDRRT